MGLELYLWDGCLFFNGSPQRKLSISQQLSDGLLRKLIVIKTLEFLEIVEEFEVNPVAWRLDNDTNRESLRDKDVRLKLDSSPRSGKGWPRR